MNSNTINSDYSKTFNLNKLKSGLYAIRLTINGKSVTRNISIQ